MPILYVHGVKTRDNEEYRVAKRRRIDLLRSLTLPTFVSDPSKVTVLDVFWGDLGVVPDPSLYLPAGRFEPFGALASEVLPTEVDDQDAAAEEALLRLARLFPADLADLLYAELIMQSPEVSEAVLPSLMYLLTPSNHNEISEAATISALTDLLTHDRTAGTTFRETFGRITEAGQLLRTAMRNAARKVWSSSNRPVARMLRDRLHADLSMFLGDVLKYFADRGSQASPGRIPSTASSALESAIAARTSTDPYVIILAHSLGGLIAYETLAHFRPDLYCDVFVTVGSQVAWFKALTLTLGGIHLGPSAALPTNIRTWLNVIDENDLLGFPIGRAFAGAQDYYFETGAAAISSHSAYFTRPSFYARLGSRLQSHLTYVDNL